MKKILLAFFITIICFVVNAQTNVSGGIYSNTTWTKANSPYIVVDTVVVFPGVILTIEPGVTVKFADSIEIEVRQAELIANGTSVDSITFTSNSSSPVAGIYSGIYLNGGALTSSFDYCNISYAKIGIKISVSGSLTINHSNFNYSGIGINPTGLNTLMVNNSNFNFNTTGLVNTVGYTHTVIVDSCSFNNNTGDGLHFEGMDAATISHCSFSNNGNSGLFIGALGLGADGILGNINYCNFYYNKNGILCNLYNSTISNCNFLHNTIYGLDVDAQQHPYQAFNNYVRNCLFDSNQTGLAVKHMTVDNCIIIHNQTGIQQLASATGSFSIILNSRIDSNAVIGAIVDSIAGCKIRYNGIGAQGSSISGNDIEYNIGANIKGGYIISGNIIRYGSAAIDSIGNFVITNNIITDNGMGLRLYGTGTISCNDICNNGTYNIKYFGVNNVNASRNYWCTDSASLEALIYDGFDNINYGLVLFMPFDSLCAPNITAVNEFTKENSFRIYPNPLTSSSTLQLNSTLKDAEVIIYDMLGKEMMRKKMNGRSIEIEKRSMESGVYFVKVYAGEKQYVQKLVVE